MAEDRCPAQVWDQGGFHSYSCGRKVKRDGLCGVHAGVKERRAAADALFLAKREEADRRRADAPRLVARLERHGLATRIAHDGTVTLATALEVADALDATYPPIR